MWAGGGLFQLRPPPPVSSGANKSCCVLGFLVWYLNLLLLVVFVFESPLYLGFLLDLFEFLPSRGTFWPLSTFLGFLMSESTNKKPVSAPEVVPMMSKITENKLTDLNYLDLSKTIRLYLRSIRIASHLDEDPPIDDSNERWMEDDAHLSLQIRNSINGKALTLINHCEFVNELMDYLEFVYSGKENISHIFDVCRAFYRSEKRD